MPRTRAADLPARRRRRSLPVVLVVVALAGGACGGGEVDERPLPAPPVEAVEARSGSLPLAERLSGVVRAQNQVAVRAEIEAPVLEVWVRSGQAVERGQPLLRLDGAGLTDQLRQARAAFRLAEGAAVEAQARVSELEAQVVRTRVLAAQDLISQMELETQEARLDATRAVAEQAAARVDLAHATVAERANALAKTVVRAPVAGHLGQLNAEVGMLLDPSAVIAVLGDLGHLVIDVPLTQEMLGHVREGQKVRVASPAIGEPVDATLTRISPFLAGSFSTVGEIDLDGPVAGLLPGMFVTVDILYGESERATLVPLAAVWEDPADGRRGVWTAELPPTAGRHGTDGRGTLASEPSAVGFRPVEVVAEGGSAAGVSGLAPGTWVVTVGQHLLADREATEALVRPTSWERVMRLQGLQRESLLRGFLAEQQRQARLHGAEPPSNEEYLAGESAAAGTEGG